MTSSHKGREPKSLKCTLCDGAAKRAHYICLIRTPPARHAGTVQGVNVKIRVYSPNSILPGLARRAPLWLRLTGYWNRDARPRLIAWQRFDHPTTREIRRAVHGIEDR